MSISGDVGGHRRQTVVGVGASQGPAVALSSRWTSALERPCRCHTAGITAHQTAECRAEICAHPEVDERIVAAVTHRQPVRRDPDDLRQSVNQTINQDTH